MRPNNGPNRRRRTVHVILSGSHVILSGSHVILSGSHVILSGSEESRRCREAPSLGSTEILRLRSFVSPIRPHYYSAPSQNDIGGCPAPE